MMFSNVDGENHLDTANGRSQPIVPLQQIVLHEPNVRMTRGK